MTAHELFKNVDPALVTELFTWMRGEERDLYKNTVATLAQQRKLRPVFITKKSVTDQIAWLLKTLSMKSNDMVGEHLLQVWFMRGQQQLLIDFCDAMGIEHDGEGSVEGSLPETLDADKLKSATDTLLEKNSPALVTLYLSVFNLQTENGWEALTELLASDERLKLN